MNKKYKVLMPLQHNRQSYKAGDVVELSDDEAGVLFSVNAIAKVENKEDKENKENKKTGKKQND